MFTKTVAISLVSRIVLCYLSISRCVAVSSRDFSSGFIPSRLILISPLSPTARSKSVTTTLQFSNIF